MSKRDPCGVRGRATRQWPVDSAALHRYDQGAFLFADCFIETGFSLHESDSGLATVRLTGEYDIARREELATLFQSVNGADPLLIDMTDVSYVDSTFLNELATLRLSDAARSITIAGVSEHVARLLKTVSFDQLFLITPATGEAH